MSDRLQTIKTSKQDTNQKLVDFLPGKFDHLLTKSSVKKAIVQNKVLVDGKTAGLHQMVEAGQVISYQAPQIKSRKVTLPRIPVIYEDDHCIIVDKPGGIATNGMRNKTVENAVQRIFKSTQVPGALPHPVPAHRLDVATSGLVILSKTKQFQVAIGKMLQAKQVEKRYYAVVHGRISEAGKITTPIEGKPSETIYEPIEWVASVNFQALTLLDVELKTGRTHQIRIHLTSIDHPLAGDKQYGRPRKRLEGKGLLLCAYALKFKHPISDQIIDLKMDLPAKFSKVLQRERSYWKKMKGTKGKG